MQFGKLALPGIVALTLAAVAPLSPANADANVYVRIGPPAPRYEAIPAPPVGPHRWVWMPGYYRWDGHHYNWERGRYAQRDHGNWRAGHWEHRHSGWIWVEGGWF